MHHTLKFHRFNTNRNSAPFVEAPVVVNGGARNFSASSRSNMMSQKVHK
jgi:hypothetical protein